MSAPDRTTHVGDVERLMAIEAIERLKARYCRSMDLKLWPEMAEVFTPTAVFGPFVSGQPPLIGGRAIAAFLEQSMASVTSAHQAYMPEIDVDGPARATGIWAMRDLIQTGWRGAQPVGLQGFGYYIETYVVHEDRWCIDSLELERITVLPLASGFPEGFAG